MLDLQKHSTTITCYTTSKLKLTSKIIVKYLIFIIRNSKLPCVNLLSKLQATQKSLIYPVGLFCQGMVISAEINKICELWKLSIRVTYNSCIIRIREALKKMRFQGLTPVLKLQLYHMRHYITYVC